MYISYAAFEFGLITNASAAYAGLLGDICTSRHKIIPCSYRSVDVTESTKPMYILQEGNECVVKLSI